MSQPKYSVSVLRHTEDESIELVDKWITADQAIDLMLQINEMADPEEEELEEEEEEEIEPPKPAKKPKQKSEGKRFETKPCCGSKGARHMKDCPTNKQTDEGEAEEDGGGQPYMMPHGVLSTHQEKVSAMWNAGKSEEQIYNATYQEMTSEEFRKAMDYAKL